MAEPRIVAFTCNWCAYAGADFAGVARIQYPPNVRLIRVMCSGRVERSFILRAFEDGADGILIGGCHEADCHYISGNTKARAMIEETRQLLDLIGLGADRLRIKWVNANEGEVFADEIADFVAELKRLGPNPLKKARKSEPAIPGAEELMKRTDAYLCVECGKCTASCPVARRDSGFSPRFTVEQSLEKMHTEIETGPQLWDCLTCRTCEQRCPYNVRFSDFVRESRVEAQSLGLDGSPTQAGTMYSWMRMMATDGLRPDRLGWLEGLRYKTKATSKNDLLFFVGCLPHFEISHRHTGAETIKIARDSVAIMNTAGITPVVMPDERCCGHDLLFAGEPDAFESLAKKNAAAIKAAGTRRVVVSCPEGYETLAREYPRVLKDWDVEVTHISELMSDLVESGKLKFTRDLGIRVTYQDPCRLGRFMGVFDAPRSVLAAMPGVELVEMQHSGPDSICCGVSSWVSCGATAKNIQMARLSEAKSTGADLLVTSCPKCQIHFRCSLSGKVPVDRGEVDIPIEDLTSLATRALEISDGAAKVEASTSKKAARKPTKKPSAKKAAPKKAQAKKTAGKTAKKKSTGMQAGKKATSTATEKSKS